MLPEILLPALAPSLKLVATIAQPPTLILIFRTIVCCRRLITARRRLILDQLVRVDGTHQDLVGKENGPPDLVFCVICCLVPIHVC